MNHLKVPEPKKAEKPETAEKPKASKVERTLTLVTIAIIGLYIALTFFLVMNYKNVVFSLRRPDIMEAARKVEAEENRQIEAKIRETRQETLKRILNPAVTNSITK